MMIKECDLKIIYQMKEQRKKACGSFGYRDHKNHRIAVCDTKSITDKQEEMISMYYEAKAFNCYYDSIKK